MAFMGLFHDLAMLRVFDKSEAEIAKIAGEAPPAAFGARIDERLGATGLALNQARRKARPG